MTAGGGGARPADERRARIEAERQLALCRAEIRLLNRELTRQALRGALDGAKMPARAARAESGPGSGNAGSGNAGERQDGSGARGSGARSSGERGHGDGEYGDVVVGEPGAAALVIGAGRSRRGGICGVPGADLYQRARPGADCAASARAFSDETALPLWSAMQRAGLGAALFDANGVLLAANRLWLAPFAGLAQIAPGIGIAALLDLALEEGVFDIGPVPAEVWRARALGRWSGPPPAPARLRLWSGQMVRLADCRLICGGQLSLALDITREALRARCGASIPRFPPARPGSK